VATLSPLKDLLDQSLIMSEDWEALAPARRQELEQLADRMKLLEMLVEDKLLTPYQQSRIITGKSFGLRLGNYRVLERIGAGGMGVVFKAEHVSMRRIVAIKVLALSPHDMDAQLLQRFYAEMRAVASLNHPNVIAAFDAGKAASSDPDASILHYFVMEFLTGKDLEADVNDHGPWEVARACDLIYQIASALHEAHQHGLIHRDVKPSNIQVTADGQVKLLDFGLSQHFRHRLTEPGTILGSVDFMAPEQARDSSSVDTRVDIYGLGGTLFWALTGSLPFPAHATITEDLVARLTQAPPSVRALRPDVPEVLDGVISRMMASNPDDRYPTSQAVMRSLLRFVDARPGELSSTRGPGAHPGGKRASAPSPLANRTQRILIVDDEADICELCRHILQSVDLQCEAAHNGSQALEALASQPFDLVLLDIDMPGISGFEVVHLLRQYPPCANLKIIMFSGRVSADEMARLLLNGVDDFLTKPFSQVQLLARVRAALQLREAQNRSEVLNSHLITINGELERSLSARDSDLVHARNALVLALAKLVEQRHTETGMHLTRMQRFCRILAEEASTLPLFAPTIDANFIQMLECCAPLHDIGKVGLPDHILMKPGKLTVDERILMQTHTTIGADTLHEVARQHGTALAFLHMAMDIARHHHERFDGTGYPDRLAGNDIPLAARIVPLADVYDALRSHRVYKPALPHSTTMQIMTEGSQGQFDPALLPVFQRVAPRLEAVFKELCD